MAYGERRGTKSPGEYGFADYFGFSIAGSLGIVTAMLVDLRQSADTSALFVINRWVADLSTLFGFGELPLYAVVLLMMAIGAASIFYFQPISMQGAFAQGFGVLAALMTIAPSNFGTPLDAPMESLPPTAMTMPTERGAVLTSFIGSSTGAEISRHTGGISGQARLMPASYTVMQGENGYDITIEINFPDGLRREFDAMVRSGNMRGRLHNKETNKTYDLFKNGGADIKRTPNKLTIRSSVPGMAATTELYARVETAGYAITTEKFEARQGANPVWVINMTPSGTPLFIQRFGKSYWF